MTTTTTTSNPDASNKPAHTFRLGAIQAAVWADPTSDGRTRHATTFSRSYRDAEGVWHDTASFNTRDLLMLAKLADQVHTHLVDLQTAETIAARAAAKGEASKPAA